jgi:hypothetical protein
VIVFVPAVLCSPVLERQPLFKVFDELGDLHPKIDALDIIHAILGVFFR